MFYWSKLVYKKKQISERKDTIHAHSYILISSSPVFEAMLCGGLKEKGVIKILDIEPKAFLMMLR